MGEGMKKIKIFILACLLFFIGINFIYASNGYKIVVNDSTYFMKLAEAYEYAKADDVIKLLDDIILDDTQVISKSINLDLNNFTITADEEVFKIQGGSLNIMGPGTIKESMPNLGAILLKGAPTSEQVNYSTLHVEEGVKLEGWSGVFIDYDSTSGGAYGILVNIDGEINAVDDMDGDTGIGVYVNGNISNTDNSPIVNINEGSRIKSTGTGIFMAGYSQFNINGGYVEGVDSTIAIKSGTLNINDGTFIATGEDKTPTGASSNGINPSGTVIQIESNNGYPGNIQVDISGGTFKSMNSYVIYEYVANYMTSTKVNAFTISGGSFTSGGARDVFNLSNSFRNKFSRFISGGEFSTNPSSYLVWGYTSRTVDGYYDVYHVSKDGEDTAEDLSVNKNNKPFGKVLIIMGIIIIFTIGYILIKKKNIKK